MKTQKIKIRYIDHFIFQYCVKELKGKIPEQIMTFYIDKFIIKNNEYFNELIELYHLPNDFLKFHKKITELAELEFER